MVRHNHIGIWLLVLAHLLITFLWYSPLMFSSVWLELQDRDLTKPTRDNLPLVTVLLCSMILCYAISWLVQVLDKKTFKEGASLGVLIFFGFSATAMGTHYKLLDVSTLVLFIDMLLSLFLISMTAGILSIWKKHN